MTDICCIGHITLDKIVTSGTVNYLSGGTSFYFSNAIHRMPLDYQLVTALAIAEMAAVTELRNKGVAVTVLPSRYTVFFENSYAENQDYRTQRVFRKADPFSSTQLDGIEAGIFHLGPLLADDMPVEMIRSLAIKGKVSLDVQGYLREVRGEQVFAIDWKEKKVALQHITYLKANEYEMEVLTGQQNVRKAARLLQGLGVKEVIITLGSKGSVIFANNEFYEIPAFEPVAVVDGTGCGDTYMAGYLYKRSKGHSIVESGEFAAAMATLKIQSSGPFTGTEEEVNSLVREKGRKVFLYSMIE